MQEQPKIVDVEVLAESPGQDRPMPARRAGSRGFRSMEGPPVHPLSALLLVVVDNLWLVPEFVVIDWIITIPLCFITVFVPTLLIQKLLKRQRVPAAVGYSLLLAVIAAVPTSLFGTPVGAAMLAWFGISKLWNAPGQTSRP